MSNLKGKNVLVTGGAGLVGGHVVEKLLALGAKVFVVDIAVKPKSYFKTQKLQNRSQVIMQDILDLKRITGIVVQNNISHIFHLAAQAIVPDAISQPHLTLNTNIMGTVNILEAARLSKKVKTVVVASSDKAYGKDCKNAKEDQKLEGDHPYDVSKSAADLIARAYYKTYGLSVAVSRFANIYGPGDLNFSRIVPGAMRAIIKNETLKIRSNGKFVRDYIYVKDVAEGYVGLAEQIGRTSGQAFNFSAGHNFSVLDFVKKISAAAGKPCRYEILDTQQNEIPFQSLNAAKAKTILKWKPAYSFERGIEETYDWYRDYFRPGAGLAGRQKRV